ncbi:MAG TPA: sulfite exporter TauE/SafE family protein [Bacillota bacterium]|nr:sulfite exporter TauE/SafE family protein [Bacillota bacterium]
MSLTEIAGLVCAAVAGGAINAIAGGGTLVTFPTLLFFGMPPIVANATSTLALVVGTSGSIYGYRRHLPSVKPWLWRFVPVSLLGGLLGSVLLTFTSNKTFAKLVPFLILFATVLFLVQGLVRRVMGLEGQGTHPAKHHAVGGAILFQFAVAIYGGYFGAGIGILMLASLGFIGLENIHEMNTLKNILGSLINLVAAIWFILAGLIDWSEAGVMTVGALAGYYLGSHYSQRIPPQRVRQIITVIGFLLALVTFYKEFVRRG